MASSTMDRPPSSPWSQLERLLATVPPLLTPSVEAFLSDDDMDELDKNALARDTSAAETVVSVLRRRRSAMDSNEDTEAAVRVLAAVAAAESKRRVAAEKPREQRGRVRSPEKRGLARRCSFARPERE